MISGGLGSDEAREECFQSTEKDGVHQIGSHGEREPKKTEGFGAMSKKKEEPQKTRTRKDAGHPTERRCVAVCHRCEVESGQTHRMPRRCLRGLAEIAADFATGRNLTVDVTANAVTTIVSLWVNHSNLRVPSPESTFMRHSVLFLIRETEHAVLLGPDDMSRYEDELT